MTHVSSFLLRKACALGALTLVGAWPAAGQADTGDLVEAMALFRDGKALLAEKDYPRACPKLAESYRLDPGSGTLLALAICNERWGKLASAWGEYADVASRSKLEGRADREQAARQKALELEPLVSTLTISLRSGDGDAGLVVRRNGTPIRPALLGTAVPVDGGTQVLEASAPGHEPWTLEVVMDAREQHKLVIVPSLRADGAVAALAVEAPAEPPHSEPEVEPSAPPAPAAVRVRRARPLSPLQLTGLASLGAGVAGLVVGSVYGLRAISKNDASQTGCNGDYCDSAGKRDRQAARSAGYVSTVAFIEGGVMCGVGAALLLLGSGSRSTATDTARVHALPLAGPAFLGGALTGRF